MSSSGAKMARLSSSSGTPVVGPNFVTPSSASASPSSSGLSVTVQLPSQPLPQSATLAFSPTSAAAATSSDQVQSVVMRYLQKRRYAPSMTEAYRKLAASKGSNGVQLGVQSRAQLAVRELLRSEAGSVASIALAAPPNVDPLVIEQQYTKFKVWISESLDSYKPELAQLLYPMFTHLYLDLVMAGHKLVAQKFHKRHQSTFLGNPNFASFIKILSNVLTSEEIQRDEAVTAFQATKYSVTLSNKTFHYLMRYLQTQQSMGQPPVLLHVLHAKVDVRLLDALGAPSSKFEAIQRVQTDVIEISEVKSEKSNNSGGEKNKSINCFVIKQEQPPPQAELLNGAVTTAATASTTAAAAASSSTASVAKLKEVIKAVRDGVTPLPSTCLYRVTQHNVNCAAISQNAQILATGCDDSSLVLWDLLPNNHHNNSAAASKSHFCFDDELDNPSAIRLGCDLEDKFVGSRGSKKRSSILRGHSGPVYDVTFMARTKYLMSVSEDTTARLWDLETGLNKAIFQGHAYPIWSVDSDRLGVNIATGSMDRTAKLWHLEYTHPLRVYAGHETDVDVVRFHPNGNYLATGGADKTVRLWSHADAKMVRVFNGHKAGVLALAFSPDGKLLASAGEDRRIKIWDLASSNLLKELRGHTESIQSLSWSGDSNLLASGGQDGLIKLWDVNKTSLSSNNTSNQLSASETADGGGAAMNNYSQKSDSFPTNCANIIDLCSSPHNTLMATGLAASTASANIIKTAKNSKKNNNNNN